MAKRKNKQTTPPLEFYKKLVLNQYLLRQFGVETFKELSMQMKAPKFEAIDSEGVSGFHKRLISEYHDTLKISEDRIAQYDLNIVSHIRKINEKRDEKITFKYFQYLSLLFVEYYLDEYFNRRNTLLAALNAHVESFNAKQELTNQVAAYQESDLNKIALWNATGSGKTLLMHINYHQYRYYAKGHLRSEDGSFILLTPKEGLSAQHVDDYNASDIPASIFQKGLRKEFMNPDEISILENTKLGDKDGDKTVAAARFGNKNVVFVDEGHRGASETRGTSSEICSAKRAFPLSILQLSDKLLRRPEIKIWHRNTLNVFCLIIPINISTATVMAKTIISLICRTIVMSMSVSNI